jgi:hypothetical protein
MEKNAISVEAVAARILLVRGKKVMLDRDLAQLYGVETRVLNQAVRRNNQRFPDDFVIVLEKDEILRISQIVTSLKFSKRVTAFTEQGIAMLSGVLNSNRAIQVNIAIMRAFVKLRELLLTHKELAEKIEELERKYQLHETDIQVIFTTIKNLLEPPPEEPPGPRFGMN